MITATRHNAASAILARDDQILHILLKDGQLTRTNTDRDNHFNVNALSTVDITTEAPTVDAQLSYQSEAVRFAVQQGWRLSSNQTFTA
ncbi:hypothetical protein [Streptomyces sp. cg35]|uniref:hypothetical protein n=1 Tax=Streptomyces sp. cg35 TaxID=3421650 RepID=UPI003D1771C1